MQKGRRDDILYDVFSIILSQMHQIFKGADRGRMCNYYCVSRKKDNCG
jgi:hypothetical protein